MNISRLEQLAQELLAGRLPIGDFVQTVVETPTADLGDTQLDLDRRRRCGFPEVVFGPGKTVPTLERIFRTLLEHGDEVLATRITPEQAASLGSLFPSGRYNVLGRTFRIPASTAGRGSGPDGAAATCGHVVIVTAGTSDLPVAEEARETAEWMGLRVTMVADVGVAGPQRLLAHLELLRQCDAVVVVAGMEGALPSVVGGHVACPVVAVPTSVGYGANLGGLAPLLTMLNSCAANVTVVNIDAGFKGGYVAGLIARHAATSRRTRQPPSAAAPERAGPPS